MNCNEHYSVGAHQISFTPYCFWHGCHWQDVSRLVDLCRQSIVFTSIVDLAQCLKLIEDDPEIRLERIKNRLDPAYQSVLSGGYRDVAVNLRIVSAHTMDLCLETHICEVQLVLKRFQEVKVIECH